MNPSRPARPLHAPFAAQARLASPLGMLTAAATARGLAGLWFDEQRHHPGPIDAPHDPGQPHLAQLARELAAYWRSGRVRFEVALDPQGTPFQRAVWQQLLAIPAGELCSYGELARRLGRPQAARAVGAAVGRNPVGIVVPCHRVLGRDGALTGYAGGLHCKQALLELERARAGTAAGAVGGGAGADVERAAGRPRAGSGRGAADGRREASGPLRAALRDVA